ncbi:MAG: TM2 domain-containing protein [Rhodococcus sp. (in: high G+C Gram-positive bacteria)]
MTESGDKSGSDDTSRFEDSSGSANPSESDPQTRPEFGSAFDYDATAEASLSAPPATSDVGPVTGATGSGSGSGPGWDVHSGVGNGPGWGETPSYPPPSASETAPISDKGQGADDTDQTGPQQASSISFDKPGRDDSNRDDTPGGYGGGWTGSAQGPVYGPPDPNYSQSEQQQGYPPPGAGYSGQQGYGGQQGYSGQQGYGPPPGYPVPGGYPGGPYAVDPAAPYGRHPMTGEPYSDKSKLTGGLLGILLGPFGAGRFYLNQPGIAVAQIAVTWLTCGIGGIWPIIDGIMMLTGNIRDEHGRPLRD